MGYSIFPKPNTLARDTDETCRDAVGGMNNKARVDDWRVRLLSPVFALLDLILNTEFIAKPLFKAFSEPARIRKVLENVYVNKAAVDDELVYDIICKPCALPLAVRLYTVPVLLLNRNIS